MKLKPVKKTLIKTFFSGMLFCNILSASNVPMPLVQGGLPIYAEQQQDLAVGLCNPFFQRFLRSPDFLTIPQSFHYLQEIYIDSSSFSFSDNYSDSHRQLNNFFQMNPYNLVFLNCSIGNRGFSEHAYPTSKRILMGISYMTNVSVSVNENVTVIEMGFLSRCCGLQSINFGDCSSVQVIEKHFLDGCHQLRTIDLSSFYNVRNVCDYFLNQCHRLETINLSTFSNITSIGNYFLFECRNLQEIDLSALSYLTTIGNHFLEGCTSLQEINLSSFVNVAFIGNDFLKGCTSLQEINLSSFFNVTFIGKHFLEACISLSELDLRSFSSDIRIEKHFLRGCIRLTPGSVKYCEALKSRFPLNRRPNSAIIGNDQPEFIEDEFERLLGPSLMNDINHSH